MTNTPTMTETPEREAPAAAGEAPVPYPVAKRVLDRVGGAVLTVLATPLFAAAGLSLAADQLRHPTHRGPWLYRERRISRGREFDLLKFRTLRCDVIAGLDRAAGEHARLREADGGNLTDAGRFLKRRYLDELPQLWNVVRGDLSLVGPRPWPRSMVDGQVAGGLDYRLTTMAGLTGPVQASKGETPLERYADADLGYVEACRTLSGRRLVLLDLEILRRTLRTMRRGEGLDY
jgi:lipopolysaccharide/colanic/teichoic acid biosynthesis glycosyltransferase